MFVRSPVRNLVALALVAFLGSACSATGSQEEKSTPRGAIDRLLELQPVDVAVAPVRDQTNLQRVPIEVFRNAFVQTLIERRYTPLAPSYVDQNWVESAFKGTPPPDGLLVVSITAWDPTHLFSTGKVAATADVVLFEGADTTGRVLWQLTFQDEVDLGDGRGNPPPSGQDLIPKAVRLFTQRALLNLPMRDPVAAHSAEKNVEARPASLK
ncbi:MAG: hypothetical protein EXS08_01860 [Planctomycetes bacterium]|nr:hypothetical protein [Planctomycetota bacterium]